MKKILNFTPILCLIFGLLFLLSACTIGSVTIRFETFGGYPVEDRTFSPGQTINNLPGTTKYFYTFNYWSTTEDLSTPLTFPTNARNMTLYAKYSINPVFFTTESTINWTNSESSIQAPISTSALHLIKSNNIDEMTRIELLSSSSDFSATNITVTDKNGKDIPDANPSPLVWQPQTPFNNTTSSEFVIQLQNVTGSGTIFIC